MEYIQKIKLIFAESRKDDDANYYYKFTEKLRKITNNIKHTTHKSSVKGKIIMCDTEMPCNHCIFCNLDSINSNINNHKTSHQNQSQHHDSEKNGDVLRTSKNNINSSSRMLHCRNDINRLSQAQDEVNN